MINNSEFSGRIRTIMDLHQLSAAAFADKIQVPRSSISHLLSGRNKPSLDFVLKVVKEFEDVELYWLLNGKGTFPKDDKPSPIASEKITKQEENIVDLTMSAENLITAPSSKKIERIVIFFNDGTFKEYIK
ncbi:helix-turn-helix transcriptional regulator [Lutimonas halocynthiae]|uniref:helix-turn-helix domain-containing protein n=1 Tax=Lutimonas halocynthiae TaxID=1446477 RepID=UPI0025B410A9|nr:helix-turn-helix transcriptional regulator [Lutimonas halocynthiae]MDN3643979.1 helix-turn-helix transcriptional regulator [Lutimonas halocynthiae]